jgi:hypothetical protein
VLAFPVRRRPGLGEPDGGCVRWRGGADDPARASRRVPVPAAWIGRPSRISTAAGVSAGGVVGAVRVRVRHALRTKPARRLCGCRSPTSHRTRSSAVECRPAPWTASFGAPTPLPANDETLSIVRGDRGTDLGGARRSPEPGRVRHHRTMPLDGGRSGEFGVGEQHRRHGTGRGARHLPHTRTAGRSHEGRDPTTAEATTTRPRGTRHREHPAKCGNPVDAVTPRTAIHRAIPTSPRPSDGTGHARPHTPRQWTRPAGQRERRLQPGRRGNQSQRERCLQPGRRGNHSQREPLRQAGRRGSHPAQATASTWPVWQFSWRVSRASLA